MNPALIILGMTGSVVTLGVQGVGRPPKMITGKDRRVAGSGPRHCLAPDSPAGGDAP